MILNVLIGLAITCAVTGIWGFVQYARYRMKEDKNKEKFYMNLHYIALALLFIIGIIIMFYYGAQPDNGI
jgi:ABC-type nickel/cobalt efflux system permease component RcnA